MSAAAAALEDELRRAPVDEHLILMLRACAVGGRAVLDAYCAAIGRSEEASDETAAFALVDALRDPDAAARGVRAAAWTMTAQRAASTWPWTFHDALEVARAAMPLGGAAFASMQSLAALTACANTTAEPDTRDGRRMQFSRESLEHVIGETTFTRPGRRDLLHAIPPWTSSFIRGIEVCDEHLRELEAASGRT